MPIRYRELMAATKEVFKKKEEKVEGVNYDSFIESLKSLDVQSVNITEEISKVVDKISTSSEVKKEIISRLEAKNGLRK